MRVRPAVGAVLLVVATVAVGPVRAQPVARNIVRAETDAQGVVSDDLAAQTGWRTARGFEWQILLRGDDRSFRPADPTRIFRTGEAFKLEIEADTDLWIYVLTRGPDGDETLLFPEPGEAHRFVRKGERAVVPATGQFRFADPPGTETFRILAATEKLAWVQPAELFRLEAGAVLSGSETVQAQDQRAQRTRAITSLQERQPRPQMLDAPLSKSLDRIGLAPSERSGRKDTVVVAPAVEGEGLEGVPDRPAGGEGGGGQQVTRLSTDPADREPIVLDVRFEHRGGDDR